MIPGLVHRSVNAGAGNRQALVCGDLSLTYDELAAAVEISAGNLAARGIAPGQRVLFVAENTGEYIIAALTVWRLGAVVATAYATSGPDELRYIIGNCDPAMVLTGGSVEAAVRTTVAASNPATPVIPIKQVLTGSAPAPAAPEAAAQEAGYICYTSGTSSHPKPVVHSQARLIQAAEIYAKTWHIRSDDRVIVAVPLAWAFGLITAAVCALCKGATIVIVEKFRPQAVLDVMEKERITMFLGVTTLFVKLLAYARESGIEHFGRTLRFCLSGGEPRNEPAFAEWTSRTGCAVHDVYAATESFPAVTYDPVSDPKPLPGSAGRVVDGVKLRLVRPDGSAAPAGEEGEAQWHGHATMLGYWRLPELTAVAMTDDGWYRSGDRVRIDEAGYVHVLGRYSDVIVRGGANVSPAEVEYVLDQHPSVVKSVVVGLPDPDYGQAVAAAVLLAPGVALDAAALQKHCLERLAKYKAPTVIRTLKTLPTTANGKMKRRDVLSLFDA